MTMHVPASIGRGGAVIAAGLYALPLALLLAGTALAAPPAGIYAPGQPIITGFSGVTPPAEPADGDPLDQTFIDLDGHSMVIQDLRPAGSPEGQLIDAPTVYAATARDVGQVFGVALDDAEVPNIYLGATSAYGLDLVVPGSGDALARTRTGGPDAAFMPGLWGSAGGATGSPGSIWKVDGVSGEVSLFTTIAANNGPGLGSIVFDAPTEQFFVSDLDTGLIYRLARDGTILDSFDHGVAGRPQHELAPVADDGSEAQLTDPAFNTEDPASWGFTQPEREVYGLAMHAGRLYYAVAAGPQIWSVGIDADGSFGADARWELDVTGLSSANHITSIVFDSTGRMILAQRGAQLGSYDYSVFAVPETSAVLRYTRELPDDPATPSRWVTTPDSAAIGFRPDGENASGGLALGYGFDVRENTFTGACSAYLWATGDSLRDDPALASQLEAGGPLEVNGLQGNAVDLVRPDNDPPFASFFTAYDERTEPAAAAARGHVGGIAIWQDCRGVAADEPVAEGGYGYVPPYLPPPDYVPPREFNLTLTKRARPGVCDPVKGGWDCRFVIRVENTGDTPYYGPVSVEDWLPANPAGATFAGSPNWLWDCGSSGPAASICETRWPQMLWPGDSVLLKQNIHLPRGYDRCRLVNNARIYWPFGGDDNAWDDFDAAIARIDSRQCDRPPPPRPTATDLSVSKTTIGDTCVDIGTAFRCGFAITVTNLGPGKFNGPITVGDTLSSSFATDWVSPDFNCTTAIGSLSCTLKSPAVNAPVGQTWRIFVWAKMLKEMRPNGPAICIVGNTAKIVTPAGGPGNPSNFDAGNDEDKAELRAVNPPCGTASRATNLTVEKTARGCERNGDSFSCHWRLRFANTSPQDFTGPFAFRDAAGGATASSLLSLGECKGTAGNVTCSAPTMSIKAGKTFVLNVTTTHPDTKPLCRVENKVSILTPTPGSASNPNDQDTATAVVNLAETNRDCTPVVVPGKQCPVAQRAPRSAANPTGCCPDGKRWNGRSCTAPVVKPPAKLPPVIKPRPTPPGPQCGPHSSGPDCRCDRGYEENRAGRCVPALPAPTKPRPSQPQAPQCGPHASGPDCLCDRGYRENRAGLCVPNRPVPPKPEGPQCGPHASGPNCACDDGYVKNRRSGQCVPRQPDRTPPPPNRGDRAPPIEATPNLPRPQCGPNSSGRFPRCVCDRGFHKVDGQCVLELRRVPKLELPDVQRPRPPVENGPAIRLDPNVKLDRIIRLPRGDNGPVIN